jgi:hypothetical protein
MNYGNSPNSGECTETDDDDGLCEAYAKLHDVRKVAELNNAAMNGTVKRLRLALGEACGDPVVISSAPNALDNMKMVAHAQAEFDRINLAE